MKRHIRGHSAEGARRTSRDFLSLKEAVILADVPESRVRKDIETGVLRLFVARMPDARLWVHWSHVFTIAAVYGNTRMPPALRKLVLGELTDDRTGEAADIWRVQNRGAAHLSLDRFLLLDVEGVREAIIPRLDLYKLGLSRIEERDDVLAGEAVFRDTRLSVNHVGRMAARGVPVDEILNDYPYLTVDDVAFAILYARSHPAVGRPRSSEEIRERSESSAR